MDEHELSRRVVDSARGEMRSGFGDELWSEMEAEFEGAAVPHAPRPDTRARRRRWVLTAAAAAAIIAVAGTIALWPHDESTLRDAGGVETSAPPVATALPPTASAVTDVTSTTAPAPSTTEPPPVFVAPDEWRVALRVGGGQPLEALAVAGCDAAGNCFDDGSDPVELDAPVGSEIAVEGGLGTLTAETDSFGATSPLPMLPRRDGTWLVNQPVTSQVLTATVRDDHPDGSWAAYQVTVSPNGDPAPPPSVDLPPAHPLVPAAQPPGDLPGVVVGARDNDLVRLDRATGGETVLVGDVAGAAGDDGGCADACGIYQVSVSADGSYVVYGGPGPAIGQLYVIPSDGSGDPGHVFGGGSPGALAPDGTVAAGVAGSVFLGQADEPPPVQVAAERLLGESSQTVVPAFTPDGSRLFVAVATATGTDVVALDPAALDGTIEPVITAPGIDWVALVVRADGTLGALRRSLPGAGPVVVDVIDPAAGAVVDSIVIDDGSAAIQPTGWIDIDAAGRYLLFTDGAGQLRWTDFEVVGTIGDGWGDAGW